MVAVGADKATHMKVTAKLELKGNSIMEPQNKEEAKPQVTATAAVNTPAAPSAAAGTTDTLVNVRLEQGL